jgi:hypothetical protein
VATNDIVSFWYAPKKDYSLPMDSCLTNNDIIAISYLKREIAVFHIESEEQIRRILEHQISNNKNQTGSQTVKLVVK